ncbi:MAG TPA: DUF4233 domain-containing protein [Actinomycetes bacterium]|nr:DUF4233 domain-containing protein [Actinomycetes bacterium]
MAAPVLFFEAIVVALAIPVALALTDAPPAAVAWGFGALAVACLVCAGLLRHPWAYSLGSLLQVLVLACGLLVPAMVILGAVFGALWIAALRYGRRVDLARASSRPVGPSR